MNSTFFDESEIPDQIRKLPRKSKSLNNLKSIDKENVDKFLSSDRKRSILKAFFKARLLEHIRHSIPIRGKINIKPDVEYSEHAHARKARLGVAKVKIVEEDFPILEKVSIRDLLSMPSIKRANTTAPKLRRIRPMRAEGSYYGLNYTATYGSRGFYVSYTMNKKFHSRIALVPTLISRLLYQRGKVSSGEIKFELREGKQRLLLVIVLDASESMQAFIPIIARTLLRFHERAWKLRSLTGLISVQENTTKVLVYPTTNINKIISGFFQVEFWGRTPLALGLLRAFRLILSMHAKSPDLVPRVILFSDGLANIPLQIPVDRNVRNYFESDAQADVIAAARLLARRNVKLITVNPWHINYWPAKYIISPSELLKIATRITGGIYLGFNLSQEHPSIIPPRMINIDDATVEELVDRILCAIFKSIS